MICHRENENPKVSPSNFFKLTNEITFTWHWFELDKHLQTWIFANAIFLQKWIVVKCNPLKIELKQNFVKGAYPWNNNQGHNISITAFMATKFDL